MWSVPLARVRLVRWLFGGEQRNVRGTQRGAGGCGAGRGTDVYYIHTVVQATAGSNKRKPYTERASSSTSQLKHIHTVAHAAGTPRIWDPSLAVCTLHAPGSRHRGAVPTCSSRTPQSAPQSAPLALQTPGLNAPASRCTLRRQETAPDRSQDVACMIPAPRAVPQLAGKCRRSRLKCRAQESGPTGPARPTPHRPPTRLKRARTPPQGRPAPLNPSSNLLQLQTPTYLGMLNKGSPYDDHFSSSFCACLWSGQRHPRSTKAARSALRLSLLSPLPWTARRRSASRRPGPCKQHPPLPSNTPAA